MRRIVVTGVIVLWGLTVVACSASTTVDEEPEGCRFTYEADSSGPPLECLVPADAAETCLDVARCFCRDWNPEATEDELEECVYRETYPRAMITLSDYCNPYSEISLAEAIALWIADRGGVITTEPECDNMPATLPYW